jgi:hypothetical protein
MSSPASPVPGDEVPKRLTGEAAWKAHRDAIEQRNSAAKRAAKVSASDKAVLARERRLALIEDAQIRRINTP